MSAATSAEAVGIPKSPAMEEDEREDPDVDAPWGESLGTAIGEGECRTTMMQNHH